MKTVKVQCTIIYNRRKQMKIEALDKNGFQCNNGYIENISKI